MSIAPGLKRHRGSAIMTVMVVAILIMFLGSTLVNRYIAVESRAVEMSLAELRIYWAMHGQLDYVLSRTQKDYASLCPDSGGSVNCNADNARASAVNQTGGILHGTSFRATIGSVPATEGSVGATDASWIWTYPGYSASLIPNTATSARYTLTTSARGGNDAWVLVVDGTTTNTGRLKVRFFLSAATLPGLGVPTQSVTAPLGPLSTVLDMETIFCPGGSVSSPACAATSIANDAGGVVRVGGFRRISPDTAWSAGTW